MSRSHKKKKKFFNSKQKNQNLNLSEKPNSQLLHNEKKTVHQQFTLPLYAEKAYFYGFSIKYIFLSILIILLTIPILLFFENFFIETFNLDSDQIIAQYWWGLQSLPLIILICFIPFTHYQTNLIKNYVITSNALHIIYTNQNIKVIEYKNILDASSVYGGTGIQQFRISYYCLKTKEIIRDYPIFVENISIFNIYPIKNEYFLIASFLQQLHIHNPKASISAVCLYHYQIDSESLQLDEGKYFLEKRLWLVYFLLPLIVIGILYFTT